MARLGRNKVLAILAILGLGGYFALHHERSQTVGRSGLAKVAKRDDQPSPTPAQLPSTTAGVKTIMERSSQSSLETDSPRAVVSHGNLWEERVASRGLKPLSSGIPKVISFMETPFDYHGIDEEHLHGVIGVKPDGTPAWTPRPFDQVMFYL